MCEISVVFCFPLRRVRIIQKKKTLVPEWRSGRVKGKVFKPQRVPLQVPSGSLDARAGKNPSAGILRGICPTLSFWRGEETTTGVSAHATFIQHSLSECESCFYVGTSARHWEVCRGIRHWQVVKKYFRMNAQRHRDLLEKSFREDGHVSNYI